MSIKLLNAVNDENLSIGLGRSTTQSTDTFTFLEYYIETIKLYQLLKQTVDTTEFSTQKPEGFLSRVRAMVLLHKRLMEWRDKLPAYLKFEDKVEDYLSPTADLGETTIKSCEPLGFTDISKRLFCR